MFRAVINHLPLPLKKKLKFTKLLPEPYRRCSTVSYICILLLRKSTFFHGKIITKKNTSNHTVSLDTNLPLANHNPAIFSVLPGTPKPQKFFQVDKNPCKFQYGWLDRKKHLVPVGIYLLKVNNRNTRTSCEICSKLTAKTTAWCLYC